MPGREGTAGPPDRRCFEITVFEPNRRLEFQGSAAERIMDTEVKNLDTLKRVLEI